MSSSFYSRRLQGIFTIAPKLIPTTTVAATTIIVSPFCTTTTSKIPNISPFFTKPTVTPATTPDSSFGISFVIQEFKKKSENLRFRLQRKPYESIVRRLAKEKQFAAIESIIEHQKKYKDSISYEGFAVRLISLYGKAKMFDHARKLFDELPSLGCERTIMSFNALLYACVNSEKYDVISEIFTEIPKTLSIEPDTVSYTTLIKGLCEMGQLDSAIALMNEMEKNGVVPNVVTYNTILDSYYRAKMMSEAEKLWAVMKEKDVVPDLRSYNAKLRGLIYTDNLDEAVEWLKEMEEKGVKPDVNSYHILLKAFAKDDNMEEVKKYYEMMMENDCVPDYLTYRVIIRFACAKDDFDFALEIIRKGMDLKQYIDQSVMVKVVDGLVERSRMEEAKELVEAVRSSTYNYDLKIKETV